jgi:HD-like signal output (HDOD) protein
MTAPAPVVDDILRELDALPARSRTAVEVLWLVDDPRASAQRLADTIGQDEALTTRIMRMANAPYYGLSGRITSAAFAITVLGFDTVRAVAASAAAGVLEDAVPSWMRTEASLTAAAAGTIAPLLGRSASEGTSIGLLHNLGSMLLHRADRAGHAGLANQARLTGEDLHDLERERYGAPGYVLAGAVLRRWAFPVEFVEALLAQRDPVDAPRSQLGVVLLAAVAVAEEALHPTTDPVVRAARLTAMARGHVGPDLVEHVSSQAEGLLSASR